MRSYRCHIGHLGTPVVWHTTVWHYYMDPYSYVVEVDLERMHTDLVGWEGSLGWVVAA
jgi:hypothetical protein